MEEENLGIEETQIGEKCDFFPVLGGLNVNVGGETTEMMLLEEVAAIGGEGLVVLENHVTAESEIMEEAAAVTEVLEIKADQVCERVDDVNVGKDVTGAGDALLFSEWQVEVGEDEISVDQRVGEKEEEEVMPVMHVVDSKVETVVVDVTETVSCPESQTFGSGNDFIEDREGMEGTMSEGEKFKEPGLAEVDSLTLESDTDLMVADDENDVEKIELAANYLTGETARKSSDVDEEKVSSLITEDTPIADVKTGMELITEVNPDIVNARENLQVHELGDMGVDARDELVKSKELTAEEDMMYDTKMVEVENTSVKVEKDFKLDEHATVVEYRDDAIVHEDLAAGNCRIETVEELDPDMTRSDVAEVHMEDTEVKTGTAVDVVADEIAREDTKFETEITSSSTGDPCEGMNDSSAGVLDENNDTPTAEEEIRTQDTEMETETDVVESGKAFGGKRKRGKVSKSPSNAKYTGKASSRKTTEEDVCFICFDGGELVLCDRRGCPKAYHPTCVNRDEAFFRAKGRWNCGWHMCSICEKNAFFMCYTCTFSLCKKCTKEEVILCVRGNKGFCETCMKTVMLIENNEQGSSDALTSFDDKGSWEYLFKDYYTELKSKLSLSSVEIAEAKNPWKGKDTLSGPSKQESSDAQADEIDEGSGSEESVENLKTIKSKRKKKGKKSKSLAKEKDLVRAGVATGGERPLSANSEWASKELLELVSHMKHGDTSVLSQFDVQGLLLEYIKRNKLRDPRRKSQIICDARLEVLFGKPRVGHFEMLKLLESHFLIRDEQNDDVEGSIVDTENNQLDIEGNTDHLTKGVKDRKHKTRKKGGLRGPQSNLDDYAAIDMHNISLIYLRRKLMEDLLEDVEKFHDKVIGMFVRIRISGSSQKQDLYRLVQVVGTSKAAEQYKIGKKSTDIVLEILNLDKTEVTTIDTISNQDFSEEECKRLRQSIKCGLISRLTVGEILDKTMETQEARVNDWLESETLRLSHLRDRASDLGRRKELRECVEKLQVLKTPEERRRKLKEIPEIHADPKMDPSYESDENDPEAEDSRRDDFLRSRGSSFSRRERGLISPGSDSSARGGAGKVSSKDRELSRNLSGNNFSGNATHSGEMVNEISWKFEGRKDAQDFKYLENLSSNSESADRGRRNVSRSESLTGVSSVTSDASLPVRIAETSTLINETEKMWHYQDPSGKVQGPFSMVQLRKWSNTGYFPTDLKIWKTTDKQEDSVLMADVLEGKFKKEKPVDHICPSANTLHSLPISASHFDQASGTSLLHLKNRTSVDQSPVSHTKLFSEKWIGNDITNLPSPTPKQINAGWTGGEGGGLINANPSPNVERTNIGTLSVADASVLNTIIQSSTAFSPTPNSQQGFQVGPANSLGFQSTTTSEQHGIQMHGHQSTMVHQVVSQSPLTETQVMGGSTQPQPQPQPPNYGWVVPNVQNYAANFTNLNTNAAAQPEYQRPAQSIQPNIYPPTVPDATNTGWGTPHANASMGWGNPAPASANMYMGPPIQPTVNTNSGWVPPTGNAGANIPGQVQALGPGWVSPPVQGPIPGNGWGPPSSNPCAPAPVQGSAHGNTNQGWGAAPQGNQGLWVGQQTYGGNQFSGHHNDHGRDPGFCGGRPWNRKSSFGGGGPRGSFSKRETMCPFYTNGRCRKGAHCDYRHN